MATINDFTTCKYFSVGFCELFHDLKKTNSDSSSFNCGLLGHYFQSFSSLCLQPCDKAAMLVVNKIEFFSKHLYENGV